MTRRPSPSRRALGWRIVFLSFWTLLTSLSEIRVAASVWSYFSSSDNSDSNFGNQEKYNELVSPIVNREIHVSVKAPWPSSPEHSVLCEAYCFLKDFAFLDALSTFQGRDQLVTYERATEYALELADQAGLSHTTNLLKVALTMRAMAPSCELHRTIVQDRYTEYAEYLEAFVVIAHGEDGKETIVETSSDIPESILDIPPLTDHERREWLLPNEIIRQGNRSILLKDEDDSSDDNCEGNDNLQDETCSSTGLMILYANLGGHSFATFYRRLVELQVPFVVRHLGGGNPDDDIHEQPETVLQGFGVRLDIRNVEYKVFDDKKNVDETTQAALINLTSLDSNTTNDTIESENHLTSHFLAGVNLTALNFDEMSQSLSQLQKELWTHHEKYEAHGGLIPPNWQRRKLSLQAATVISQSDRPLFTLQDVSQNLPSVASTLVHIDVPEEIEKVAEVMESGLHRLIRSSGGGLWINGRAMNVERPSFNVFEMINLLQEESREMADLERDLKPLLRPETANHALESLQKAWIEGEIDQNSNDGGKEGEEDEEVGDAQKGQYRIDLATGDDGAVIYMNDLEKDKGYSRLPTSVQQMLMAMQYGMPPSVRRNLFTVLVVDDPTSNDESSQNFGDSLIAQLAQQQYPARLAVVVAGKEDLEACLEWIQSNSAASHTDCPLEETSWLKRDDPPTVEELKSTKASPRDFHRLYAYMRQEFSDMSEILVAYKLYLGASLHQEPPSNEQFYSLFDLFTAHTDLLAGFQVPGAGVSPLELARSLQENEEDSKQSYAKSLRFAIEKGVTPGMSFINGRPLPTDADDAEQIQRIFSEEQQLVFGMIMEQKLTDTKPRNFYYKLIKGAKKNVFPRLHPLLGTSSSDGFVKIIHDFDHQSLLKPTSTIDIAIKDADAMFLYEAVLDFDTPEGLMYAKNFLRLMESFSYETEETKVVASFRILPSTKMAAQSRLCSVLKRAVDVGLEKITGIIDGLLEDSNSSMHFDELPAIAESCSNLAYLEQELPSKNFISSNGRVYSMNGQALSAIDFDLLASLEIDSTKYVTSLLKENARGRKEFDVVSRASSFLLMSKGDNKRRRSDPGKLISKLERHYEVNLESFSFTWNQNRDESNGLKMEVTAIVDPVTETAQRLSPLLVLIRDELQLPLKLILAPMAQLDRDSKIPLSSYYRFVADPSSFQGQEAFPHAQFSNLPSGHVLTLRMDVPEPWDVQQMVSIQDTDNLRCDVQSGCGDESQIGTDPLHQHHVTKVEYGLEHLLFFGQCYDTKLSPPNGLQLVLSRPTVKASHANSESTSVEVEPDGTLRTEHVDDSPGENVSNDAHYSDTLVMKTVGYWQLRANPGVWYLEINKQSKGAEIFQMMEGTIKQGVLRVSKPISSNKKRLVLGDFVGGGRGQTLLVKRKPGYEKASLFYDDNKNTSEDDRVHVFSLATGHLYERFLKIMMLSVTKRTSTKVKFWLFENFLSPNFKTSAMAMAQRIGCEVEFVTYKWPEWLRGQSEKQRIIWGYKILFLDVLFPLNVKKIIYVDSDQVVRGDLKELWDMDLGDAPYGYTPMCSSNKDTLGFQFWRHGFWESHLRGKPYHISALYVVDLDKFRRDRVGDTLRAQYQALSADPGSLANLDQDLPNYAQHQVPIFSLPQEWLWCESWCSNETKANAKTIDLCNNPLHKEPKVSMAKRIISGELFQESWIELDAEVEKYEQEWLAESSFS